MDRTVIGVILGALIAALPNLLSVWVSHLGKKAEMKHELRKMDIEIYHKAKLEALNNYRTALGRICANTADRTAWGNFKSASDTLDMFVSETTHETLNKVCDRVFQEHSMSINAGGKVWPFKVYTKLEEELSSALRNEMDVLHRAAFEKTLSIPVDANEQPALNAVEHNTEEPSQHDAVKPL